MNYPVLELSRFDRIHRTNHIIDACKYPAADDTGTVHTMTHYMTHCLFRLKTMDKNRGTGVLLALVREGTTKQLSALILL